MKTIFLSLYIILLHFEKKVTKSVKVPEITKRLSIQTHRTVEIYLFYAHTEQVNWFGLSNSGCPLARGDWRREMADVLKATRYARMRVRYCFASSRVSWLAHYPGEMSANTDAAEVRNIFAGQLSIDKRNSADAGNGEVLL